MTDIELKVVDVNQEEKLKVVPDHDELPATIIKKRKSFKEYYQDSEFKERHQKYIKEKLLCQCGRYVMRVAMAKHKRTNIHKKGVERKEDKDADLAELVEKLVDEKLSKLIKNKRSINI